MKRKEMSRRISRTTIDSKIIKERLDRTTWIIYIIFILLERVSNFVLD